MVEADDPEAPLDQQFAEAVGPHRQLCADAHDQQDRRVRRGRRGPRRTARRPLGAPLRARSHLAPSTCDCPSVYTRLSVAAGFHGLSQSVSGQPSIAGEQLVHRGAVDGLADDVALPGVPGQLLDHVEDHPAHGPRLDVLREPRRVARHGHRRVEVGRLDESQRLGVLRLEPLEQLRRASRRRASRTRRRTRPDVSSTGRSSAAEHRAPRRPAASTCADSR